MVFVGRPDLLVRFRRGDIEALEAVYFAYVDRVARTIHAVMRSYFANDGERIRLGAAELGDLVQEVFARAFSSGSRVRYDSNRPYGPYLAQIGRNVVVDHWRASRRHVLLDVAPLLEGLSLEAQSIGATTEDWADRTTIAVVERYLAALDPDLRRVHDALYVRGLSQRDAASALGLGRQAVRGIEARLRAGLRLELERSGEVPEGGVAIRRAASGTLR